jgi:hypothetical protein
MEIRANREDSSRLYCFVGFPFGVLNSNCKIFLTVNRRTQANFLVSLQFDSNCESRNCNSNN